MTFKRSLQRLWSGSSALGKRDRGGSPRSATAAHTPAAPPRPPPFNLNEDRRRKRERYSPEKTKAIKRAVWLKVNGKTWDAKCITAWCPHIIDVFSFQCAHDIPASQGGQATVENLYPMCAECNGSMGDRYTLKEWNEQGLPGSSTSGGSGRVSAAPPPRDWSSELPCGPGSCAAVSNNTRTPRSQHERRIYPVIEV